MSSLQLAITDLVPFVNSSVKIPSLGFGVYQSYSTQCIKSCLEAFKAGYRHIDTAQLYANEKFVGDAVRQSGIPRGEIFITTKVWSSSGSAAKTYDDVLDSVDKIDGDDDGYVDLFLVHQSSGGAQARKEMWLALEKLYEQGKTRAIGVSNWGIGHIEEMKGYAKVFPPHVNQLELHPWCQQRAIVDYCKQTGIVVEAYCPLVRNRKASDPILNEIANSHHKSTAQVLIRYSLQKGWVPLPKSDTPSRIAGNANVYDFDLSPEDMAILDSLDQGSRGAIVQAVRNTL